MADVDVVLTTYFPPGDVGMQRMEATLQAVRSWLTRIRGVTLGWVVADDGSDEPHLAEFTYMMSRLTDGDWENVGTLRLGCAAALAVGVHRAVGLGAEIVFYAQDDWELTEPLDLGPALWLIRNNWAECVRLGPTHPNLRAEVVRTDIPDAEWCLRYDWSGGGYVLGWRPALYDAKMLDLSLFGLEGLSAIEAERVWLERMPGLKVPPRVFHAPNTTLAGPFRHIETVELGEDDPATLTARYA